MKLGWRQHGYNLSTKIDQRSHVMNRTLFSLFGLVPIIFLLLIMLAACGGSSPSTSGPGVLAIDNAYSPKELHAILRVPEEYSTIQAAVNAAVPGDMVSIGSNTNPDGAYHESVTVKTPNITIRGRDRNTVILDGQYKLDDGFEVLANNVVIENITARHYTGNGFYWTGVTGYRGSYLTAYSNGEYGIYSYQSVNGQFDHSFTAGQPDSGFYIGACHPCHALITNVISEDNALGFSGTNAGGDLVISDSRWRNNMGGIVPNTLDSEPGPPQNSVTIINNLVENNNNYHAPAKTLEYPSIGNGIMLAGGINDVVKGNRISGQKYYGILVISNLDTNFWEPRNNTVMNNIVTDSGVADLAPAAVVFNHFMQANMGRFSAQNWKTAPVPADIIQPGMSDPTIALQGIRTLTDGTPINMTPEASSIAPGLTLGGLGLSSPFLEVLVSFYTYFLPLALYGAWLSVITWDVVRRSEMKTGARLGWLAIAYLIPVLGPLAYFFFAKSPIQRAPRFALAIGAPVIYLGVAALLLFFIS